MRVGIARSSLALAWLVIACGKTSADPPPTPPAPPGGAVCGNAVPQGPEGCDDGNQQGGDGCTADCQQEKGWTCTGSGCTPLCGDGLILGNEACDQGGNLPGGSYCSADCTTREGECGDKIVQVDHGEVCDFGLGSGSGGATLGPSTGGLGGEGAVVAPTPYISFGAAGCFACHAAAPGWVCDAATNTCQQTGVDRNELAYDHKTEMCEFIAGLYGGVGTVFQCTRDGETHEITVPPTAECVANAATDFNQTCTIGDFETFVLGRNRCDIALTPSPCDGP